MRQVFIYGGCTSRDSVDYYPQYGLELHSYIARQSLISAFRPADAELFDLSKIGGTFQRRMLAGDITGTMPGHLKKHSSEIDLMIWDLMIERVGVRMVRSGGAITRNGAPLATEVNQDAFAGSYVFGTDAHFRQWKWALGRLTVLLDALDMRERVVVNATPWATRDKSGQPFESSSSMKPEWFNEHITRYWDAIEAKEIKLARVPQALATADPDHKWGPAYFHYVPETYLAQLDAITAAFESR